MTKIYLAISTSPNELDNLKELTAVWGDFDGLAVTFHGKIEDDAYKLLDSRKKEGFVSCLPYLGHHGHDLAHILYNPLIKLGDFLLLRDSAERIAPSFSINIKPFVKHLTNLNVNTVYQRSKLLMFRRFPHQSFSNTPHWAFQGGQSKAIKIEETGWFKDDSEYCYSVRKERPPLHFVDAYVRYYLILDSNHNLLGLENFGNPNELFPPVEQKRMDFLLYLQQLNINNDVNSLKEYILKNKLDDKMKDFFNSVRCLNDFYQLHVLKNQDLIDDIARPCKLIS